MDQQTYRLGFDIGGTFTDFVLINERTGQLFLNKCLTTPHNPADGVIQGLGSLFAQAEIDGSDVSVAIHATTLVSNALIERKGARTALLTTDGFRDVLEMGTEVRYDIYDLFLKRPEPLVPRRWRFGVKERVWRDGSVLVPLDRANVEEISQHLSEAGIESVAICFLHSFRNKEHEEGTRAIVQRILPNATISLSSEVAPEIREYERMSTTVANAYVQPILHHYIQEIERRLQENGYRRRLFFMLSSGGTTTGDTARTFPIRLAESGPAAGVLAAAYLSRFMDVDTFVSFDMGGTTAKIGLVDGGRPSMAGTLEVARVHRFKKGSGIPIKIPVLELIEIGAGGGSIAHVDSLGLLKVGPESAGSDPGPACYGLGGKQPTVTDANLLLGYLSAENFLGGAMILDRDAADQAVSRWLAEPLGISATEAARGIHEVVNQNMLSAMKVHIAERGEDPRRFYLFGFGGAGPAHAYELARLLNMKGIIVPPGAGATSALGLVVTPNSFEYARSFVTRLDRASWAELHSLFDSLEDAGLRVLRDAGVDFARTDIDVQRSCDLRHKGQGHELTVTIPPEVFSQSSTQALAELFYDRYAIKYGHAHKHLPVELITCRCTVTGPEPTIPLQTARSGRLEDARKGTRPVYFVEVGDYVETVVYDRSMLGPGMEFRGPAVVEERECTTVVGPSGLARIDNFGHLIVNLASVS